jgi:hypothetical protein
MFLRLFADGLETYTFAYPCYCVLNLNQLSQSEIGADTTALSNLGPASEDRQSKTLGLGRNPVSGGMVCRHLFYA